jgi:uncharacterized protein (DUF697 family)
VGVFRSAGKYGGRFAATRVGRIAPGQTERFLTRVLDRAINGAGPFDSARDVAAEVLEDEGGDVDRAVKHLIDSQTRLAGAQGFLTNIGGLVTAAVTIPANVAGLIMVQLRLHAAIAHLYGLDLDDEGVRSALLVTLLGSKQTDKLVRNGDLPGNVRWLAEGGANAQQGARKAGDGPSVAERVTAEVASTLVAMLGGKQLAGTVGKRIPLLGGVIGGVTDARSTRRTGQDAARDLPRHDLG